VRGALLGLAAPAHGRRAACLRERVGVARAPAAARPTPARPCPPALAGASALRTAYPHPGALRARDPPRRQGRHTPTPSASTRAVGGCQPTPPRTAGQHILNSA